LTKKARTEGRARSRGKKLLLKSPKVADQGLVAEEVKTKALRVGNEEARGRI